ncbi:MULTISPECIES: tol-pal system protein YbgF [Corallincola]|uniref:Cell division coordinator CpoB n=3 Tax=Corallincola TaxID=1775176 RepID=A0A368NHV4_9GAMM|nr:MULTISPECIES: tol-pal system protein YbgF [Corallincola]RCU49453.1 tol-pal system protein YbgF [Corallincola holothuriorum]TAA47741.1 tol-pal system protein YbgF [Corallincola spongiicola]TCI01506.1 tol-pal system protein YbgF [Corallincola luteus]
MKYAVIGVLLSVSLIPAQSLAEPAPVKDLGGASEQKVAALEQQLVQSNRLQLQTQQSLQALQSEVDELRGMLETQNHQMQQILQRQRELYQELDRRLANSPVTTPTVPDSTAGGVSPAEGLTETAAYEKAVNLVLKDKQYDQAIPAFYDFINQYPASDLTPNARYWLGQLLFNKGQRKDANAQFEAVVNQYPNSPKRADAMLKMAMISQLDGDNTGAKNWYNRVIKEYPDSPSAQIARTKVSSLK